MGRIKEFFKSLKWYDYAVVAGIIIIMLTIGIIYHSDAITIISAIFGPIGVFFLAKGNVVGQMFLTVQGILYSIISYLNGFYGEVIITCLFTIPLYIVAIVTWFKNLNASNGQVKVNRKISWKEWLIMFSVCLVISVGIYFLLQYFNTRYVLLGTFSFAFSSMASYLSVRRCEYNFIFYILNNIILVAMWILLVVNDGNFSQIITFVNYIIFMLINLFGFVNWIKLKKKQGEEKDGTSSTSR